jgi:hypothetical protein
MKQFELNQTYCKVLLTISELNKQSYYPLNEGIYKILVGIIDDEVMPFSNISSFGTLTSYSSKKICHLTLMLFRKGLIGKVFDPETKKLYLRTTDKGEEALKKYFAKHKKGFAKRKQKSAPTIVKISG